MRIFNLFIALQAAATFLLFGAGCASAPSKVESPHLTPQAARELASGVAGVALRFYREGKYHDAHLQFRAAEIIDRTRPDYRAWQAACLAHLGELDRARASIREAVALGAPDGVIHYCRAIVFLHSAMWREAQADLDIAIEHYPSMPMARFARSQVHYMLDNLEAAIDDASQAIECGANHPEAYNFHVELLLRARRYAEAKAAVQKSLKKWPDSSYALVLRGAIFRATGEGEAALADFKLAYERAPEDATERFRTGALLNGTRTYSEALKWLQLAVAADPAEPAYWHELGATFWNLGRHADALSAFERATVQARQAGSPRYYSALYAAALRMLRGDTRADVETWVRTEGPPNDRGWEHEIAQRLLNLISADALLKRARTPGEECEAHFFNAIQQLYEGELLPARLSLAACLATGKETYYEYAFAAQESRR